MNKNLNLEKKVIYYYYELKQQANDGQDIIEIVANFRAFFAHHQAKICLNVLYSKAIKKYTNGGITTTHKIMDYYYYKYELVRREAI